MSSPNSQRIAYKIALRALLVAAAMILSWIEAQIPAFFAVPGIKLGLTNLVVLMALYKLNTADAVVINMLRIVLVGFSFGNVFSILYSVSGGLLSFAAMFIAKNKIKLNCVTVSVFGGVFHNIGQILIAMIVLSTSSVMYYLPFLWISGIAAGTVIGILAGMVIKYLPKKITGGNR